MKFGWVAVVGCEKHVVNVNNDHSDEMCPKQSRKQKKAGSNLRDFHESPWSVGGADFVYPPLRRGSRSVSYSNPEWAEIGQVREREDGRKTGDVGERDRVEVFSGKCGNM